MLQLRLVLLGLTLVGTIGYAVYNHYRNQEQNQPHSNGPRRRRRSSGGAEGDVWTLLQPGPSATSNPAISARRRRNVKSTCSICLALVVTEGRELSCTHVFHRNCIQVWFNNSDKRTCPNCRAAVL